MMFLMTVLWNGMDGACSIREDRLRCIPNQQPVYRKSIHQIV